jgi:hypothetical protein
MRLALRQFIAQIIIAPVAVGVVLHGLPMSGARSLTDTTTGSEEYRL